MRLSSSEAKVDSIKTAYFKEIERLREEEIRRQDSLLLVKRDLELEVETDLEIEDEL